MSITGTLGTVGNIVATLPLTTCLHSAGWTPTFLGAGLLSLVAGAAVYLMLPRAPKLVGGPATAEELRASLGRVGHRVRTAWGLAGTRAGFWVHFTAMSTSLMFGVLWGVPFLVQGQGFSRDNASALLLVSVALTSVVGPFIGLGIARYPASRVPLAMGSCLLTVAGWYVTLAVYRDPMPRALLIALVLVTALGGPVSSIGFAVARDYNGPAIVGTATGVVNVAGFVAAILASLAVGWTLSLAGGTSTGDYRAAFAMAVTVQAIGLVQLVRWWLRARRALLEASSRGESTPVLLTRHRWDLG